MLSLGEKFRIEEYKIMDWKLTKESEKKLRELFFSKNITKIETSLDAKEGRILLKYKKKHSIFFKLCKFFRNKFRSQADSVDDQDELLALEPLDKDDAKTERDLLLKEWELGHEIGKHWDLLRWNISKFFLGIETIFIAGAINGLLKLANTPLQPMKFLLSYGILIFSVLNILFCLIWLFRNIGIHTWHRAATTRALLIEADPRMRETIKRDTTIIQNIKQEGFPRLIPHSTGKLESWGPPIFFIFLWIGVFVICCIIKSWPDCWPIVFSLIQKFTIST